MSWRKAMNVLITGASGFIGSGLIRQLRNSPDTNIFALSRKDNHLVEGATLLLGDVLDYDYIDTIFLKNRFDAVIHLAAITAHSDIVDNRFKTFDINLKGTENILRAFNKYCNNAVFFYASTGKVYGNTNEMPISEKALVNPINILGKTKRITEEVIDFYAQPNNKYIIGRIFNIYGEHQKDNFIIPTILNQLENDYLLLGNLTDKRDYLYINDLLQAIRLCILNKDNCSTVEYINIGSGIPISVNDILLEFEMLLGKKLSVKQQRERMRKDETSIEYCNNSKLKKLTNWQPKYSFHDGLKNVINWFFNEKNKEGKGL